MKEIISTQDAPAAIGPYSQATASETTIFVSGQLPIIPSTGQLAGGIEAQTRQSLDNIGAILKAAGSSFEKVLKTTVLLADINDFAAMNAVYAEYFPKDAPARACFQVAALPRKALVEIEVIAER